MVHNHTYNTESRVYMYIPTRNIALIWNPVPPNLMISHHLVTILNFASVNFLSPTSTPDGIHYFHSRLNMGLGQAQRVRDTWPLWLREAHDPVRTQKVQSVVGRTTKRGKFFFLLSILPEVERWVWDCSHPLAIKATRRRGKLKAGKTLDPYDTVQGPESSCTSEFSATLVN